MKGEIMKTLCYASCIPLTYISYDMPPRPPDCDNLILRDRRIFTQNFKKARKKAGLSQEQLVPRTGLTRAYISKVETGKKNISLDNAIVLANAVGESLGTLLSSSDE